MNPQPAGWSDALSRAGLQFLLAAFVAGISLLLIPHSVAA
jgi:hypothetical protein